MLQRNEEILVFEFLKCCSKASGDKCLVTLSSFESCPAKTLLSRGSAEAWAVAACKLSVDSARQILQGVTCFVVEGSDGITFSQFIVFAVKCFVSSSGAQVDDWRSYLSSVKLLIERCSERLNCLNTLLGFNVLDLILSKNNSTSALKMDNLQSIYDQTLGVFNQRRNLRRPCDGNVPPRPPDALWDAPRYIAFLKFIGLSQLFMNFYDMWHLFGVYLRGNGFIKNTSQWSQYTVPPSPILISITHIMELLKSAARATSQADRKTDGGEILLELTLSRLLPALIAIDDDNRSISVQQELSSKLSLEDIFRFGGDNAVHALRKEDSFLRRLLRRIHSQEGMPSADELIRLLTVDGTFPAPMLSACVKRYCIVSDS